MNAAATIIAALVLSLPLHFIWYYMAQMSKTGAAAERKAVRDAERELGVDYDSATPTGLYHPTHEATTDSFARRAEADRQERRNPIEDWGRESAFSEFPTGVYPSSDEEYRSG